MKNMKVGMLMAALAAATVCTSAQQGAPGRVRPPAAVTCDRNDLTVYTGRVTSWDRKADSTTLTIATDWKTTEQVVIKYPVGADPGGSFLMQGKSFAREDWARIATDGKLKDGARASAWVCRDGRNPIVDWERPSGG
jgi:hypothetical protein